MIFVVIMASLIKEDYYVRLRTLFAFIFTTFIFPLHRSPPPPSFPPFLASLRHHQTLLGVDTRASQAEITSAYRKLALKHHPDRNRGSPDAAEKFAKLSDAYACLSDPTKRRQYDISGSDTVAPGVEAVDVQNTGFVGRWAAAQFAKLGVPLPTTVSPQVLGEGKDLSRRLKASSSATPEENNELLQLGRLYTGRLALSSAVFFRLQVTETMARDGVIIAARSKRKNDRFRILVFDENGDVKVQNESSARLEGTTSAAANQRPVARCRLFHTPYSTVSVNNPFPSLQEDVPPVCFALDTLEERAAGTLDEGTWLIALYSDNFLSQMEYFIAAIPAEPSSSSSSSSSEGGSDGADARVSKMSADAAALQKEKSRLSSLSETIVARREALAKAQKELKESLQGAQRAEESVAALLRAHADSQQAIISKSLEKAAAAAAGVERGAEQQPTANPIMPPGNGGSDQESQGEGPGRGFGAFMRRLSRADQPPPPAGPAGAGGRAPPSSMEL